VRRARAAGVLLWAATLAAPLARAEPAEAPPRAPALVSFKRAVCLYTACFLEPLLPDVRYELGPTDGWVLSWPIHPWASPPLDIPGPTLLLSPFVEPQLRLRPSTFRLLAGARVYAFPDTSRWGALVEGAGVLVGRDGRGGGRGVGLTYDLLERHRYTQPWTLSLVYRRTWTPAGARHDVSFDVTVPLRMFLGSPMDAPAPEQSLR
jgi:hypothetical protein